MKDLQAKTVVKHIGLWLLAIYIKSIDYIELTENIPPLIWWQIVYNWGSLILVFYGIIFFMIRNAKGSPFSKMYLANEGLLYKNEQKEILPIIILVALYMTASLSLDTYLFKYEYPTFRAHFLQRFAFVFPVALIAMSNARKAIERRGAANVVRAKDNRIKMLNEDADGLFRRFEALEKEQPK
jgi:hypothetical protein